MKSPRAARPMLWGGLLSLFAAAGGPRVQAGPDTWMVGITNPLDAEALRNTVSSLGGRVQRCFSLARICVVELPGVGARKIDTLADLHGVRYVERDRLMSSGETPPEPFSPAGPPGAAREGFPDIGGTVDCPDLWELPFIGILDAWTAAGGWGGSAPVIAVEDSGFLTTHEELVGRISGGFDYGNWDSDPEVEWDSGVPSHGTFIAGMLVARDDNDAGRVGILPEGRVNLQKIADNDGALYFSYAVSAMADIAEGNLGVRVLSYSIAGPTYTQAFKDAVAALEDAGILLVTSAGNCSSPGCSDADNDQNPMYPGNFSGEHIVVVAGVQRDGRFNPYSHYGRASVDLAAPGVDLCSLGVYSDDDYYTAGGTSYATPIVAGVAGLLLEAYPDLTTTELARILRASVVETDELADLVRSGGYLSAARALTTAVPRLTAPADAVVDGDATLSVPMENPAAGGEGILVLFHDDRFMVADAGDWAAEPFQPGDTIVLPDAGTVAVTEGGTLIRGFLPARSRFSLPVVLHGLREGRSVLTLRLVATSAGADYLNAPYDTGKPDPTGFLALSAYVEVRAVWEPTPTPDPGGTMPVTPSVTGVPTPTGSPTPLLPATAPSDQTGTPVEEATRPVATLTPAAGPTPGVTPGGSPTPGTPAPTPPATERPVPQGSPTPGTLSPTPQTVFTPPPSPTPTPRSCDGDCPSATCPVCPPCQATPVPAGEDSPCPAQSSPCPVEVSSGCNIGDGAGAHSVGWGIAICLGILLTTKRRKRRAMGVSGVRTNGWRRSPGRSR